MKDLNLILQGASDYQITLEERVNNIGTAFLKSASISGGTGSVFVCIDELQNTHADTIDPSASSQGRARRALEVVHGGSFTNTGYNHTISTFPPKTLSKLHVSFFQSDGVTPVVVDAILCIHLE